MKTVVVGDIHGQYEVVEKVLALKMPTVFVGDFMDSYTRSPEDSVRAYITALTAVNDPNQDVIVLYGNHERSYIDPEMLCSGYKRATQAYISLLTPIWKPLVKHYHRAEGFLISHAGVSQYLLDTQKCTVEEYLEAGKYNQIGSARGGYARCGGLYWCDWNMEFEPVEGTPQIVGHTRGKGIREKAGSYCIDCLEDSSQMVAFIEDGVLESVPLEDL